jgi:uncharacterized membrane protein YkoI
MISAKKRLWRAGAVALIVALVVVGAVAATGVADDDEQPITGEAYEKAVAAALQHTGGGRVTETEVGDEDSYYEVEVTLDNGRRVDVQLDENFNVVGTKADKGEEDDRQ